MAVSVIKPHVTKPGWPKGHDPEKHSLLKKLLDQDKAWRVPYEPSWLLNLLFFAGRHWVWWEANLQAFMVSQPDDVTVRAVYNKFKVLIQRRVNRAIRAQVELGVIPSTSEPADQAKAETYEKLLQYIERQSDLKVKWMELVHWVYLLGTGALRPFWDDSAGPREPRDKVNPKTGKTVLASSCPVCEGTGFEGGKRAAELMQGAAGIFGTVCEECAGQGGIPMLEEAPVGDANIEVVSPFDMFPQAGARRLRDCERFTEREVMTIQELGRRWPHVAAYAPMEPSEYEMTGYNLGFSTVYPSLAMNAAYGADLGFHNFSGMVEVYRMWTKPDTDHPNGQVYVFTDRFMIEEYENPYPDMGPFPHVIFTDFWTPSIFAQPAGDDIRELNAAMNSLISGMIEIMNLIKSAPMVAPIGSMEDLERPMKPGGLVTYSPLAGGQPPKPMDLPNMPRELFALLQELNAMCHEVAMDTQGGVNLQDVSGRHEALLQERAEKDNTYQMSNNEAGRKELGKRLLTIIKKEYTHERRISIVGTHRRTEYTTFIPDPNPMSAQDLYVVEAGQLPDSKIEASNFIVDKAAQFMLDDDTGAIDHKRVLKALKLGRDEYDDDELDRENAVKENAEMAGTGQAMPIREFENHKLHMRAHATEMKKHNVGEPAYQACLEHMMAHHMKIQQRMMEQVMLSHQQIAGGGAPQQIPTGAEQAIMPPGGPTTAPEMISAADTKGERMARTMGKGGQ